MAANRTARNSIVPIGHSQIQIYNQDSQKFNSTDWAKTNSSLQIGQQSIQQIGQRPIQVCKQDSQKFNSTDWTKTNSSLQIGQPEIQFYRLDKDKFKSATKTATKLNSTDLTKKSILQIGQPQIQF